MDVESDSSQSFQADNRKPKRLTWSIIDHGCPLLEQLEQLRNAGYEDDELKHSLDRSAATSRRNTDRSTTERDYYWFRGSRKLFEDMDKATKCIPNHGRLSFLDLGCCPGGFACYILNKKRKARGTGVSLDERNGGHGLTLAQKHRARFEMHWADLTFYDICSPACRPAPASKPPLVQIPFSPRGFQLAILDGHHRRPQESDSTHPWDIDRLLIAQLIIALESLETGGTIVITLPGIESSKSARIVYMLDKLSTSLVSFKQEAHDKKTLMAKGVGEGVNGDNRDSLVTHLKKLWWELTFGGSDGEGRWSWESDLDFIVTTETLINTYLDRLIELGRGPWEVQKRALSAKFERIRGEGTRGAREEENF